MTELYYSRQVYAEESPECVGTYEPYLTRFVEMAMSPADGASPHLLDVGAGTGLYAEYMIGRGCQVTALDSSNASLESTSAMKIYDRFGNIDRSLRFHGIHAKDIVCHHIFPPEFFAIASEIISPFGVVMLTFKDYWNYSVESWHAAARAGFQLSGKEAWTPAVDERDWYGGHPNTRSVMYFAKTAGW